MNTEITEDDLLRVANVYCNRLFYEDRPTKLIFNEAGLRAAMKEILQVVNQSKPGLNWVKCSDRMPDFPNGKIFRFIHTKIAVLDVTEFLSQRPNQKEVIEWLDETSTPNSAQGVERDFLAILQENWQAQIAGFYNDDKTDLEKAKRNAVIEEYQDLISIYKLWQAKQKEETSK